ncbi:MAG: heme ABC exporter ATP-binding protein CcmA [Chloroflexota bacterium]
MIRLNGVVHQYGMNPVLRGVNLQVNEGEFVTLVGPNGAGKSTLMRIVATLLRQTGGEVTVGGWPLPAQADRVRRHIGLVSHQPLLYHDLTAAENLSFFARAYQIENAEERVMNALRRVGLFARQRDPVGTFSRGMVQRLTIARATLHEPDVLLLDEPYTGLDQEASHLLDELLREQAALGRTILMITHDLGHGLGLADRLVILYRGQIAREVSRSEINPAAVYDVYSQVMLS